MGLHRELDNLIICYFKGIILKVSSWIFQYLKGFLFLWSFLANKWNIEISGIFEIFIFIHVPIYFLQVVAIIEKRNNRACTGNIMLMTDKNRNWAFFRPIDSRMPRMRIPMTECPKGDWKAICFLIESTVHIFKKKSNVFKLCNYMYM